MKTKYYCQECCLLKDKKDIAYKYDLNLNGKTKITEYICKDCEDEVE